MWVATILAACGESRTDPVITGPVPGDAPTTQTARILLRADPLTTDTEPLRPKFTPEPAFETKRQNMIDWQIRRRGVSDPEVLVAMTRVPRHRFVGKDQLGRAYTDRALPIGHGQTISQPYIVAAMTEALKLQPEFRVLEIGTGSGYQAAILAEIVREVDTIEIVDALARESAELLRKLGYTNINVLSGDGYAGWPARAPYDAIIVTAAPEVVPPPLVEQLKSGGRMVIPVGPQGWSQKLTLLEKDAKGNVTTKDIMPVGFVPFTRKER